VIAVRFGSRALINSAMHEASSIGSWSIRRVSGTACAAEVCAATRGGLDAASTTRAWTR
jgi:hypothetical protein